MTAIVIWRNDEVAGNPSLWVVADSKVSDNSGQQLIGDAVKVMSLPIICRGPDAGGFFSNAYFVHTLGYCFAGSTLMGQNTFLGLSMLLSNLMSTTTYIPSMEDIARHILAYLTVSFRDYSSIAAKQSFFETALFGYCHRTQRLEIFVFSPRLVNGVFEVSIEAFQDLHTHDFVYLGDNKAALRQEIAEAFTGQVALGRPIARAPRFVIQDHIASDESPTIGGDLQLAIADRFGLQPYALCRPCVVGQPAAYFSFLGREQTSDLTSVGEAQAILKGMI
jgi:hypothetical protein